MTRIGRSWRPSDLFNIDWTECQGRLSISTGALGIPCGTVKREGDVPVPGLVAADIVAARTHQLTTRCPTPTCFAFTRPAAEGTGGDPGSSWAWTTTYAPWPTSTPP